MLHLHHTEVSWLDEGIIYDIASAFHSRKLKNTMGIVRNSYTGFGVTEQH